MKLNRSEEVVINRLRLNWTTHMTHGYLMDDNSLGQRPVCEWCGAALCGTVPHVTSLSLIAFEPLRHLIPLFIIQYHLISYIVLVMIIIPPELRIVKHKQHS